MEITLTFTPEEYNIIHKGLSELPIKEALPLLQKLVAQVQLQLSQPKIEDKE